MRRVTGPSASKPAGLPFAPDSSHRVRMGFTQESKLPANSSQVNKEAVGYSYPLNVQNCSTIASLATNALYWRITRITVAMEPALSTSTQIAGISNADSYDSRLFSGYGDVFKKLRALHLSRRSAPGGNVLVSWPISMDWMPMTNDAKTTLRVPSLFFAVTNPGVIETKVGDHEAWVEWDVSIEYITGG